MSEDGGAAMEGDRAAVDEGRATVAEENPAVGSSTTDLSGTDANTPPLVEILAKVNKNSMQRCGLNNNVVAGETVVAPLDPVGDNVVGTDTPASEVGMEVGGLSFRVETRGVEGDSSSGGVGSIPSDVLEAALLIQTLVEGGERVVSRVDTGLTRIVEGSDEEEDDKASLQGRGRGKAVVIPGGGGEAKACSVPLDILRNILEGARSEDIAAILCDSPCFVAFLAGEDMPEHVRDMEREEEVRQRETETASKGPRVTIVVEVERAMSHRAPFTPETYVPRAHFFIPSGCESYRPRQVSYDTEMVLRDRSQHLAADDPLSADDTVSGYGGSARSLRLYHALPQRVRDLVDAAGFGLFIEILTTGIKTDRAVLRALMERWWDTTNSFHLPFGEMTITPLDFAAITGLRVGGDPIPFDSGLYKDTAALEFYLGRVPMEVGEMVRYTQFEVYWDHEPASATEAAQMARAYLLYLFGASLFPNRRSEVHLGWLPALADLTTAHRFDWGGSALCTLYCFMGAVSRGVGSSLGGFWRVLEVWAYEVLGMYAPENTHENSQVIPRAAKWAQEFRKSSKYKGELRDFRLFLDRMSGDLVHWDVWDWVREGYLTQSREVTRRRVLLESPYGWQWYLGERVSRQSLRLDFFRTPRSIPILIQRTQEYTLVEIEQHTVGEDLAAFFDPSLDYAGYRDRYLAARLNIEERLRAANVVLPPLKRSIDVTTSTGRQGLVLVPFVSSDVSLEVTEVPLSWATDAYRLILDLSAMVRQSVMGVVPKVRPRVERGTVSSRVEETAQGGPSNRGAGMSRGGTSRRRKTAQVVMQPSSGPTKASRRPLMKNVEGGSSRAPPPVTGTQMMLRARRPRPVPEDPEEGGAADSNNPGYARWRLQREEEEISKDGVGVDGDGDDEDNDGGAVPTRRPPSAGPATKKRRT